MEENKKNKKRKNRLAKKFLKITNKLKEIGVYDDVEKIKSDEYEQKLSYTKKVVAFVLINAEIQIYCSYVLGFLGRDNIAEELSTQVVITVLGAIGFYCIKSLIENLSKYNIGYLTSRNESEDCEEYDDEESCGCDTAEDFLDEVEQYMN